MISYYGDFAEDDTVLIPFNTFSSDDPSASVTISDLVDADLKVHKDGGLTQIVTDGATIAIDYDGITGNHLVTIDTSAHADYAVGSEYAVRMEGTTVDGATINAWIGAFSIERAGGVIALLKLIQAAVITNAAGADVAADIIAVKAETALIVADTNELQVDDVPGLIAALDAVVDTVKAETALIVTDTNELQVDNIPGLIAALDAVVDTVKAETALIVADTNELQVDWINGGRLDLLLDAIPTTAMRGTDSAALASVCSEARLAELDAANLPADRAAMEARFTGVEGATFATGTDSLEAIRDRGDAAWTTGAGGSNPFVLQNTTIATLATQVSFTLTAGSADDDAYNGMLAIVEDATTATQKAIGVISDYVGATKTITLREDPGIFTMAAGDTIDVVAVSPDVLDILADTNELQADWVDAGRLDALLDAIPTTAMRGTDSAALASVCTEGRLAELDAANLPTDVAAVKAETALIVADTNELQTDDIPAAIVALDAVVDTVKAETALIVADTNELQVDWVNGGRLDLILDIIAADTTTDIPALLATLQADTDNIQTRIPAALVGGAMDADVSAIQAGAITAASIAAAAFTAAKFAAGAIDAAALATDTAEEIRDAVLAGTITELVADPGTSPTLKGAVALLYMGLRNQLDITATTHEIHNNAGGVLLTATLSDDGTTFRRTKHV